MVQPKRDDGEPYAEWAITARRGKQKVDTYTVRAWGKTAHNAVKWLGSGRMHQVVGDYDKEWDTISNAAFFFL